MILRVLDTRSQALPNNMRMILRVLDSHIGLDGVLEGIERATMEMVYHKMPI